MRNSYFTFKQFNIEQGRSAMKVSTDACLFGAIVASNYQSLELKELNILDIGAGTGLLSMMLQQALPSAKIDAVEIDDGAFLDLQINCTHIQWERTPQPVHQSIQRFINNHRYEMIICNPPFFTNQLKGNNLQRNIARHTDDLSWEDLVKAVKKHIQKNGTWWLLLPLREWNLFVRLIEEEWKVKKCYYLQSYPTSNPHRVAIELCLKEDNIFWASKIKYISIYQNKGQYTEAFRELLTDYYLYL